MGDPIIPEELDAIEARAKADTADSYQLAALAYLQVPRLVAEVRRLREAVREMGACDDCHGQKTVQYGGHYQHTMPCPTCHGTGLTARACEALGEKGGRDGS